MNIDNAYMKVEGGEITFKQGLWRLPAVERAFDGFFEGKPSKEQENEILNDIHARLAYWLEFGPQPEGWDQFSEVTQVVGKKVRIQIWDPIMFMNEDEGPAPFEAKLVGLNLTLNSEDYIQCYMCLKNASCQQDADGSSFGGRLQLAPDRTHHLSLGDVYQITIIS